MSAGTRYGWWLVLGLFAVAPGCGAPEPSGPSVGSNSNWLRACTAEAQCVDAPTCVCGACSERCNSDADCDALPDARCAPRTDPAAEASCGGESTSSGLCLPRCEAGTCNDDQACVAGACVLAALPDNAFCADVRSRARGDRTHEDALLALVQTLRTEGGVSCGGAAVSTPVPALRLDPRLSCAARVFALDLDAHGVQGLVDSQGRSSPDRLAAAGYSAMLWGESFALDATSAEAARDFMLAQPDSCARLTDAQYLDVGVGSNDTTWVVTIGVE